MTLLTQDDIVKLELANYEYYKNITSIGIDGWLERTEYLDYQKDDESGIIDVITPRICHRFVPMHFRGRYEWWKSYV